MMVLVNHLAARRAAAARGRRGARSARLAVRAAPRPRSSGSSSGHERRSRYEPWPAFDEALCIDDVVEMAVQVNGKVRGQRDARARRLRGGGARRRRSLPTSVAASPRGKPVKKFIYVPGKIINVVV